MDRSARAAEHEARERLRFEFRQQRLALEMAQADARVAAAYARRAVMEEGLARYNKKG